MRSLNCLSSRISAAHSDHGGSPFDLDRPSHRAISLKCWLIQLLLGKRYKHLGTDGLEVEGLSLEPGVGTDLIEGHTRLRVVVEKSEDQVLELVAELCAVHLLPIRVNLALE